MTTVGRQAGAALVVQNGLSTRQAAGKGCVQLFPPRRLPALFPGVRLPQTQPPGGCIPTLWKHRVCLRFLGSPTLPAGSKELTGTHEAFGGETQGQRPVDSSGAGARRGRGKDLSTLKVPRVKGEWAPPSYTRVRLPRHSRCTG